MRLATPSFEVKLKVLQLILQHRMGEDRRLIIEHVEPSGPLRLQPECYAPAGPYSSIFKQLGACALMISIRVSIGNTLAHYAIRCFQIFFQLSHRSISNSFQWRKQP